MTWHIPSMFVMLIATSAALAVVIGIAGRAQRNEGINHWAAGLVCVVVALVLWTLRGQINDGLSIVLSNMVMASALALFARGLLQFQKRTPPHLVLWLPVLCVGALHTVFLDNQPARFLVNATFFTAQSAWIIGLLWQRRRCTEGVGQYLIAAGFVVLMSALVFQGSVAWMRPHTMGSIFQATDVQGIVFIAMVVHLILCNLGLLIMCKERVEARIRSVSLHDELTGLLNRRALLQALDQQLSLGQRSTQPLSVLMIDIDFFKRVNDTYGHITGDRVLQQLAATVNQRVRAQDLAGRLGGEEFLVILPGTDASGALQLAETLRQSVEADPFYGAEGQPIAVTVSIGVCTQDVQQVQAADVLIARADQALYRAKQNGRNRVEIDCN